MKKNVQDPNISPIVLDLLLDCGIPPHLIGYNQLARAIELYVDGTPTFHEIYRIIAAEYGVEEKSIMRAITYAINQSFDLAGKISHLFNLDISGDNVHSALVIAYLGVYVRRKDHNDGNDSRLN